MTDNTTLWIVIPVYNDWKSLSILLGKLREQSGRDTLLQWNYLVVDDGSKAHPGTDFSLGPGVTVLRLRRNLGHQRAISIGLSYLSAHHPGMFACAVMDADGEDDPSGVNLLIEKAREAPGNLVFASRTKRQEGVRFRFGYALYKVLFRLLTGHRISFGNFSLVPGSLLSTVVNISEIWNHYSGGLMKARIPYVTKPIPRGKRYAGDSQMNYQSLVLHGLRSISVYLDQVAARFMSVFLLFSVFLGLGVLLVLYLKFFTALAIPGWATAALSGLLIMFFQALLVTLFMAFMVLNQNTQRLLIPAIDFVSFLESVNGIPYETVRAAGS